jgi:hypothetical protein
MQRFIELLRVDVECDAYFGVDPSSAQALSLTTSDARPFTPESQDYLMTQTGTGEWRTIRSTSVPMR